jgi:hypothetical protein
VSIAQRISSTWERDGLSGIALRTAVYSLRRIGWRADAWSNRLDYRVADRAMLRKYGGLLQRNEPFRGRHEGRRCFVIGNGPSLKTQDLTPLADEITFVTNYFHLHPIVGDFWQPTYYCLSDPAYFDGREPITSFSEIVARITTGSFFVSHHAFEFLERSRALPPERTYYIASCEGIQAGESRKPDLTKATPGVQTVVQLAVMAAIFMGCSPIYLLGLDHDWLAHGGTHLNFYSEEEPENQPEGNLPGWSYHSMLDAVLTMWKVYELQERVAEAAGIKIINATRGGFLDVFERANYEKIIAHKLQPESSLRSRAT